MHAVHDCNGYVNRVDRGYGTSAEKLVSGKTRMANFMSHPHRDGAGRLAGGTIPFMRRYTTSWP